MACFFSLSGNLNIPVKDLLVYYTTALFVCFYVGQALIYKGSNSGCWINFLNYCLCFTLNLFFFCINLYASLWYILCGSSYLVCLGVLCLVILMM